MRSVLRSCAINQAGFDVSQNSRGIPLRQSNPIGVPVVGLDHFNVGEQALEPGLQFAPGYPCRFYRITQSRHHVVPEVALPRLFTVEQCMGGETKAIAQ